MTLTLPRGLLAAVLFFWAWRVDGWLWSVPMAVILEAAPFVAWRWALNDKEWARVIRLTALLWVGALIILFVRYLDQPPLATHLYTLASWFPILLFPALAVQRYSTAGTFRVGHLLYGQGHVKTAFAQQPVRLEVPYLMAALLAASITVHPAYLLAAAPLLFWAIYVHRPRRYRTLIVEGMLMVALVMAFVLSSAVHRLQLGMEEHMNEWLQDWLIDFDPYRTSTALGDIGTLKFSERILVRVQPPQGDQGPWLLQAASYNTYFDTVWQARGVEFTDLLPQGDGREWPVQPTPDGVSQKMGIALELRKGTGMLLLPSGAWQLSHLPMGSLQRSSLGAIKASDGPGLIRYQVSYVGPAPPTEEALAGPPSPLTAHPPHETFSSFDLGIPHREKATLQRLVEELGIIGQAPTAAAATVHRFLNEQFSYSLDLPKPVAGLTALETFLLHARAGHCEYFATAAVLLLRTAGIPARYATGFSVSEYSPLEGVYIARRRHAHAWAQVWIDGQWHHLDATPPDWLRFEDEQAPWWQKAVDVWDGLVHQLSRWRWREADEGADHSRWLWAIGGLLTTILFWRVLRHRRVSRAKPKPAPVTVHRLGMESPFYHVLEQLAAERGPRPPGEAIESWLQRLGIWDQPGMADMVRRHQRWRFDPAGLPEMEQRALYDGVAHFLATPRR
jgi:protein-glutamine gamma-glutamyltransferase